VAMLISGSREMDFRGQLGIEVMAADRTAAEAVLAAIRGVMRKRNIYRGHVISLRNDDSRQLQVDFHRLPKIGREDIILPEGLLDRVERLTVKFSEHRDRLAAAGRHLKRGLLLYGPPGTGKTLTAMHLAGRMSERTTILLTGGGLGLIEQSCAMARALQPATLILEDVDLVAEERTAQQKACNVVLFELLNQMDGLADDADLLFLLTTNRPEMLEAALASLCAEAEDAIHTGYNILIVSDRNVSAELMPIPALLATAAVHQHLVRMGLSGLKLDRGDEDTPSNPTDVYFDGRTGAELRNAYPVLAARVHHDAVQRVRGDDFLVYPRCGYAGSQRWAVFSAGDVPGKLAHGRRDVIGAPLHELLLLVGRLVVKAEAPHHQAEVGTPRAQALAQVARVAHPARRH